MKTRIHWMAAAGTLLWAAAAAWGQDPFEIWTEGNLSVNMKTGEFTAVSETFVSAPMLRLDSEVGMGTAIFNPDEVITQGRLTWSGPSGTVAGGFTGRIPIIKGEFGLGRGWFTVDEATGDFVDWIGLAIPFTSQNGKFDPNGNATYENHYVPEPSTLSGFVLGALALARRRRVPAIG